MRRKRRSFDQYPHGSTPKTPFEQWEESRTRCLPHYCMYAYACETQSGHIRYVPQRQCFRYRPSEERPPTQLSAIALEALEGLRNKRR